MHQATTGELAISSAEPAFITNHLNRIVSVNRAASDLLGFDGADAEGLPCWRLLDGSDVVGNRFCRRNCPLLRAALRGEMLPRFPLKLRTTGGSRVCVGVSALALYRDAARREPLIVHVLGPCHCCGDGADRADPFEARGADTRAAAPEQCMLTCRELEILHLMNEGVSSDEIAHRLFISVLTVRTHIERILSKLGVHSKLEATAVARRLSLV